MISLVQSARQLLNPKFILALLAAFFIYDYVTSKTKSADLLAQIESLSVQVSTLKAENSEFLRQYRNINESIKQRDIELEKLDRANRSIRGVITNVDKEDDRNISPLVGAYLEQLRNDKN